MTAGVSGSLFLGDSEDEGDFEGEEEDVQERNGDENLNGSLSAQCDQIVELACSPSFHLCFWLRNSFQVGGDPDDVVFVLVVGIVLGLMHLKCTFFRSLFVRLFFATNFPIPSTFKVETVVGFKSRKLP